MDHLPTFSVGFAAGICALLASRWLFSRAEQYLLDLLSFEDFAKAIHVDRWPEK